MPGEPHGALGRALAHMTVGVVKSTRARDQRDAEMGFVEIMQHFQLPISGTTGTTWGFAVAPVTFDFPFYYAPGQRDPDFDRPQFWFGAEISPSAAVSASVYSWTTDPENGAIIGAEVSVGVMAAVASSPYTGVLHLTFQGFSALSEEQPDVDA